MLRYDWGSKAARRAAAGGAGAVPELQQLLADPHVKVRCAVLCCAVLCLVFFACQGLLHVVVVGVRDPYGEWAGKRWERVCQWRCKGGPTGLRGLVHSGHPHPPTHHLAKTSTPPPPNSHPNHATPTPTPPTLRLRRRL